MKPYELTPVETHADHWHLKLADGQLLGTVARNDDGTWRSSGMFHVRHGDVTFDCYDGHPNQAEAAAYVIEQYIAFMMRSIGMGVAALRELPKLLTT